MHTTDTTLALGQALQLYFQGEKTEALVFILPLGLLSLVFGCWLVADQPVSFTRGVAIPFIVMGLLMTVVGGVVGFRTPGQVHNVEQAVQRSTQAAARAELERMDKVNRAWPAYLAVWGLFGVVGLALRFATPADFTRGLGIALVFFAGVGLLVDGFAERRTHPYMAALKNAASPVQQDGK